MTTQEIIQEFKTFSAAEQVALMSKLFRAMQEKLEAADNDSQTRQAERAAAVERLRGIAGTDNPPMTKEETRKEYYDYLAEKYS